MSKEFEMVAHALFIHLGKYREKQNKCQVPIYAEILTRWVMCGTQVSDLTCTFSVSNKNVSGKVFKGLPFCKNPSAIFSKKLKCYAKKVHNTIGSA